MDDEPRGQVAWPRDAWRLRILLDAPSLKPPAVEYAVFPGDPIIQFAADLRRLDHIYQAKLNEVDDLERRQTMRRIQLAAVWNRLFHAIRGDEVYLLVPGCSDIALMSNASAGRRWVVTKPVQISDRTVTWSVPFEAVAGEEAEVHLAESNALDLVVLDNGPRR